MSEVKKISLRDPKGYIWTPSRTYPPNRVVVGDWTGTSICVAGPNGDPMIAEAFGPDDTREHGWEVVDFDPGAPRNPTQAERDGVPLVRDPAFGDPEFDWPLRGEEE